MSPQTTFEYGESCRCTLISSHHRGAAVTSGYDRPVISRDDVLRARETIGDRLERTPTIRSTALGARLKCELFQKTGSFKSRGALAKLSSLTPEEKARGVITISAGNHAQAVAYAAAEEGVDALVVMWRGASEQKIEATRGYGATVDLEATSGSQAFERLAELLAGGERVLVHPARGSGRARRRRDRRPGDRGGRARTRTR